MRQWLLLGVAALVLAGIAAYLFGHRGLSPQTESAPVEIATAPATPATPAASSPQKNIEPPSFDVVRVEPTGELVVGGRGEPGAGVTLLGDGTPLDQAKIGANGQFAMVPQPLKPGPHNLTLSMKMPDGQTVMSAQNVAVDIPDGQKGALLVAKTEAGKPTEILTAPAPAEPLKSGEPAKTPEASAGRAMVAITVVEAEDTGTLYAAGKAAAGATVRLYLNDAYLATADVGTDASWSLKIAKGVVPGQYRVRVDDVDAATGKVLSRAEVGFDFATKIAETAAQTAPAAPETANASQDAAKAQAAKPAASVVVDSIDTTTVVRGDSLWRISRKTYGSGYRYTVIHEANQAQIRDPDLIYPGQIFVLPKLAP